MLYQLASGRVINITLEQYLEMTDEDIQYMISTNYGDYIHNPFQGSVNKSGKKPKKEDNEEEVEDIDTSIDYVDEDQERFTRPFTSEDAFEDIPEAPDQNLED